MEEDQSQDVRYEPEEVVWNEHQEEYAPSSNQIVSNDALDEICWCVVETYTNFTPIEDRVEDCLSAFEDDIGEVDEKTAAYEEGYHTSASIFMADIAQRIFNQGVDILARARRFEKENFEQPEMGPVHDNLPDSDEVSELDTQWLRSTPQKTFLDE